MAGRQRQKHMRWTPPAAGAYAGMMFDVPTHDTPLAPRDEAVFLLHTGAEIEHALLVQYLYAAYSLRSAKVVPEERAPLVKLWRKTLLGIAREEMGHLITVQNLLRLIGGPLNMEREDYPFRSELYPFHFRLEPLSRDSLAKYVVAEMPYLPDPSAELREIMARAATVSTMHVNQVGAIYARVLELFSPGEAGGSEGLSDDDFVQGAASYARYDAWGGAASVLVPDLTNRAEAVRAIRDLAEQGEGLEDAQEHPSHYHRFLAIYREFPEQADADWEPTYPVPADPTTSAPNTAHEDGRGHITHPRSAAWARMFNLRYRLLLEYLAHSLLTEGPLLDDEAEYTPRGLLNKWTFDEMRHLSLLAAKLATLPLAQGSVGEPEDAARAGAPFELPYTLALPDREQDRWRTHLDVQGAALAFARSIARGHPEDASDTLLQELVAADTAAREQAEAAMLGEALPRGLGGFRKVVQLLESGVRGFRVGAHHNFWRDCTRDEFVALSIFGTPLLAVRPDGSYDADGSNLIKALRGEPPFDAPEGGVSDPSRYPRMPAEHPPLPPQAIAYIHRWIEAGCPED